MKINRWNDGGWQAVAILAKIIAKTLTSNEKLLTRMPGYRCNCID
jgi:hypothetical protein